MKFTVNLSLLDDEKINEIVAVINAVDPRTAEQRDALHGFENALCERCAIETRDTKKETVSVDLSSLPSGSTEKIRKLCAVGVQGETKND